MWPTRWTASGTIRKEAVIGPSHRSVIGLAGGSPALLWVAGRAGGSSALLLWLWALLTGCGAPPKSANEPKPKERPFLDQQITVHSPNGEATVKNEKGKL